jgi:hypothetical protein
MSVAGGEGQHDIPGLYVAGYRSRRLARPADHGLAGGAGLRLRAIDPPGGQSSDRSPRHSLSFWARDATGLADQHEHWPFRARAARRGSAGMAPVPERQREIRGAMTRTAAT